jgi:putative ABC transport system permease protein
MAILTLALGIGATTAIFTVLNSVLLRPLPFHDPSSLVYVWGNTVRAGVVERRGASYPDFLDWKSQSKSFNGMAGFGGEGVILNDPNEPERITAELVSSNYFDLLGVRPAMGRVFVAKEDEGANVHTVALISHALWSRKYGSDPAIVGKTIRVDNELYTIAGVLPQDFRGLTDGVDVWLPLSTMSADDLSERGSRWLQVVARLKPGVSVKQAQAEIDGICKHLAMAYPRTNDQRGAEVIGVETDTFSDVRKPMMIALSAALLVLLIACLNVSNLLLARAEARHGEMAIRLALGATGTRLVTQVLAETAVPAGIGTLLGLVIASRGTKALLAISPIELPSFVKVTMDARVFAFSAVLALATTLIVGLLPALQLRRRQIGTALTEAGSRTSQSRVRQRIRSALVVSEVALALVLLFSAGLLMRSFERLTSFDPGFDPRGLLSMRVYLGAQSAGSEKLATRELQLNDILRSIPGVTAASVSSDAPLSGGGTAIFYTPQGTNIAAEQQRPRAYVHRVGPDFFSTVRIPIIAGRSFLQNEMSSTAEKVIVSRDVVRRYWPNEDPIGKRLKVGLADSKSPWLEVVGVVGDVNYRGIPKNPTPDPDLYFPLTENGEAFALALRTPGDPGQLQSAVRAELKKFAPAAPIFRVATGQELLANQLQTARFARTLMGVFASVALLLALIGIYGVTSFLVERRTREIGIRIALGATRSDIFTDVLLRTLAWTSIGLIVGVVSALAFARLLKSMLYGVSAGNPLMLLGVALLMLTCALLASYLPARRATRVDPMVALRYE